MKLAGSLFLVTWLRARNWISERSSKASAFANTGSSPVGVTFGWMMKLVNIGDLEKWATI